jgi:16S rRNA C967 or C1407 C5-methylase (RsmB/RsmF family)
LAEERTTEMILPEAYRLRVERQLGAEAASYFDSLAQAQPIGIRLNPIKSRVVAGQMAELLANSTSVPGVESGHLLTARPSFILDPCWHEGAYYVQDPSSMQAIEAISRHWPARPLRALDRCAAPGGKATHLAAVLPIGSLLVATEPIATRRSILIENLTRWGLADAVVQDEPRGWLPGSFDVIVIDAPCSGEGLFRKQPSAMTEWSEAAVAQCATRQQRILDETLPLLAADGLLAYCTCTAAPAENTEQIEGLLERYPELAVVELQELAALGWAPQHSEGGQLLGYQAWAHRVAGEGLFVCLLHKKDGDALEPNRRGAGELRLVTRTPLPLDEWLSAPESLALYGYRDSWHALHPDAAQLLLEARRLGDELYCGMLGTRLGEVKGRDALPDHALALSVRCHPEVPTLRVDAEQALRYLKREAFETEVSEAGWHTVSYGGLGLGWVKAIGSPPGSVRLNNYLPATWRIRRDLPTDAE